MNFGKLETLVTSQGIVDLKKVSCIKVNKVDKNYTKFLDERCNTILLINTHYAKVVTFLQKNKNNEIAFLDNDLKYDFSKNR